MSESVNARLTAIDTQLSALRSELLVSAERFNLVSESGALEIDLKSGAFSIGTPAGKVSWGDLEKGEGKLAGVGSGEQEQPQLCIDPGQSVTPLRMGSVTFYGESARQIRAAQEVLRSAGVGQLEVVKRANEPGQPFVVIDDQVFLNQDSANQLIDPLRLEINTTFKTAATESGRMYVTGLISEATLCEALLENIERLSDDAGLANTIRHVIRDELKPGGMLYRG